MGCVGRCVADYRCDQPNLPGLSPWLNIGQYTNAERPITFVCEKSPHVLESELLSVLSPKTM